MTYEPMEPVEPDEKAYRAWQEKQAAHGNTSPSACSVSDWLCDCGLWHDGRVTRCHSCELRKMPNKALTGNGISS